MKVAIGADHGGLDLKSVIVDHLCASQIDVEDFGAHEYEGEDDYPDIAQSVGTAVATGEYDCGILICGTGIGMSMAANKITGIRAALCTDEFMARLSRYHNNANVLALGGRTVGPEHAKSIVDTWMDSDYTNEQRHNRRIEKLERAER